MSFGVSYTKTITNVQPNCDFGLVITCLQQPHLELGPVDDQTNDSTYIKKIKIRNSIMNNLKKDEVMMMFSQLSIHSWS